MCLTLYSGSGVLFPFIASYMFISINSKTSANLPVGSSYRTSSNVIMFGWGDNLFNACISLRLFTYKLIYYFVTPS